MFKSRRFLLLIWSVSILAPLTFAQSTGSSPAEKRGREVVQVLSSGSRPEVRKYVDANFGGRMAEMPMRQHLDFFSSMYDSSRGFEVESVKKAEPDQVTLVLRNKLTGDLSGLAVTVEPKEPFKIIGIGIRRVDSPSGEQRKITDKQISTELEAFVKKLVAADAFSGAFLVARDGEVIVEGAYGMANKDFAVPNNIDTKFNLGSMNKMFTSVAIAQLVEKGKLSYDDPLSKFIPDFPNPEAAKKIKIKHLLTHTAGLGGYFSERYQSMSRLELRSVDDMMKLAREDEKDIRFAPGSRWQYSNTGMLVLGKVIEVASGGTYFDYVREFVYRPAGMKNTDSFELDKVNSNLAVGYDKQYTDDGFVWGNNVFAHVMRGGPHGGGYSTVRDLLKFDRSLRTGKLVSLETFKLLTSPKTELNSPEYGYGFGVDVRADTAGHSGGFPGISSILDMHLGSGWTVIVMSNYSRGSTPVFTRITSLIAQSKK